MNAKRILAVGAALTMAVALAGCGGAGSGSGGGKNLTIRIGIFPVVSPVPVMQQQKKLEKQGYTVKWVQVNGGLPQAASALAAGKLDMVYANSASAITIFAKSPKVAEFVGRSFVNLNVTVASNKSGIKSAKQLASKPKVVVSGMKTASTLFYELGAKKAGVTPDRDNYFVSGTGPGMVGVMASGGADVAAAYVPYSTQMVKKKLGHVLFTASDALGMTAPGDGFIARQGFAKKHPEAVVDVLRAQFAATDTIKKDPAAQYQTIASFAKVDVSTVKYAFSHGDIIAPSYAPGVKSMETVAKLAQQNGFAPKGVDLAAFAKKFANTSFAKKAAASK